ncbi:hypothetical protein LCGC14_0750690 [marine sediment metagenome]|uniref:Uncharacterized protein n=1 Tax=marine sediment metagenome TaxID=412755 RepID=A0A0F9QNV6_9ZZZZ
MKLWKDAFNTWENLCPFVKRELLTKVDFVDWAEKIRLIDSIEKEAFYSYINILEECEVICPLVLKEDGKNHPFDYRVIYSLVKFKEKLEPLYHPLQFFQIIYWFKHSLRKKPYYPSKEFKELFSLNQLQLKIEKMGREIEFQKHNNISTKNIRDNLTNLENKLKRTQKQTKFYPKGKELRKKLQIIRVRSFLTEDFLSVWIKIESLLLQDESRLFAPNPPMMKLNIEDETNIISVEECIRNYRIWRKQVLDKKKGFLSEDEIKYLKDFHWELNRMVNDSDFGNSGNKGNWFDLFDLIPSDKKDKLEGFTSFYINLLSIKRYIERACWDLFEMEVLKFRDDPDMKPYFCYNNKKDYDLYMRSILLQFDLISSNPFILYVEGETERILLLEYLKRRRFIQFKIINIKGIGNVSHYIKITEDFEDKEFYFFIDYDSYDKYMKNARKYGDNCAFFFQDFVTENFSTKQFYEAFISWIDTLHLSIKDFQKEEILKKLQKSKLYSEQIKNSIQTGEEINEKPQLGFEKIVINFLQQLYSSEMQQNYPQLLKLNKENQIENTREFKDLVKTQLVVRLKTVIIESMELDPQRKDKIFPFEEKLKPFIENILKIINITPISS